jgi:hypothetical protein
MTGPAGNILGIRLRTLRGKKLSVRGGREGLFVPAGIAVGPRLFVAEGASDVCAGLDLRLPIIGRPSCNGGTSLIIEFVRTHDAREIIIVADADAPGQKGAERLAAMLLDRTKSAVRVISPPTMIKDLRDWKVAGAMLEDLVKVVESTKLRRAVPVAIRQARRRAASRRVK